MMKHHVLILLANYIASKELKLNFKVVGMKSNHTDQKFLPESESQDHLHQKEVPPLNAYRMVAIMEREFHLLTTHLLTTVGWKNCANSPNMQISSTAPKT